MKIVTAAQMQALDRRTITEARIPGLTLMSRAGASVVAAMERVFAPLSGKAVAVVCGKGNNGGDGFVVARLLRQKRARARVLLMSQASDLTGDARTMYRRFMREAGKSAVHVCPAHDRTRTLLESSDLIVDALLGTGLSAPVTGPYRTTIEAINDAGRPVIAVDLPSGIHADTGVVLGTAVRAFLTITFGLPKLGLYVGAGIDHAGEVHVADIGIPPRYVDAVDSPITLLTLDSVRRLLPKRIPSAHKGTYGHVGLIAGSVGKTGAAALAAKAALRVGAGLVTVATPASVNDTLESKLLEAMTVPMPETKARTLARSGLDRLLTFINARTAAAVGPGLTTHPETVELVHALIGRLEKPMVLDADARNALTGPGSQRLGCGVCRHLLPWAGRGPGGSRTRAGRHDGGGSRRAHSPGPHEPTVRRMLRLWMNRHQESATNEWTYQSRSPEETERLGQVLGASLKGGEVLALYGDLGTGKTVLVRGIATGVGCPPRGVTSPTFVLIHERSEEHT